MTAKRTWSKASNCTVVSNCKRWRIEAATKINNERHFLLWDLNKEGVSAMIKAGLPSLQAAADLVQDIEDQEMGASAHSALSGANPGFDDSVLTDFN